MKVKSIKAITLSMPFSHGGKKVIFHGKEWKSLEFNLVKIETDKGITGWGEAFGYTSWKAVKIAIEDMVAPLLIGKDISNIPEVLLIQVIPSGEVRMVPFLPTLTKVLFP